MLTIRTAVALVMITSGCTHSVVHAKTRPVTTQVTHHVEFTLPFDVAIEKARSERRLLFLKPIYGGVDEAGAADYRLGRW